MTWGIARNGRRRVPRVVLAIWIVTAVVLWNGLYDLRISVGTRDYLLQAALHDAGRGPAVSMAETMQEHVRAAVTVASFWTALVSAAALWSTSRLLAEPLPPDATPPPATDASTRSG